MNWSALKGRGRLLGWIIWIRSRVLVGEWNRWFLEQVVELWLHGDLLKLIRMSDVVARWWSEHLVVLTLGMGVLDVILAGTCD